VTGCYIAEKKTMHCNTKRKEEKSGGMRRPNLEELHREYREYQQNPSHFSSRTSDWITVIS
jgi:hypothetical protein